MVLAIWLTRPSYCSTDARHPLSGVVKSADRRMYFDAEVADGGDMVMADAAPGAMRTASTEKSAPSANEAVAVRSFFPETWLFQIVVTG